VIGVLGCNIDSLLGATIQAIYKCPSCGTLMEKKISCCGQPLKHYRGIKFIDNNAVNLLSTMFGAIIPIILYFYI
jgi:uncharacterized membrane protein